MHISLCQGHLSRDMRFPTMWYVRPAKPQTSLRIRAVWSEPLLVYWIFYEYLAEQHLEFLSSTGSFILFEVDNVGNYFHLNIDTSVARYDSHIPRGYILFSLKFYTPVMVMSRRSVHLTTHISRASLTPWISGRTRTFHDQSSGKYRSVPGSNSLPLDLQWDSPPTPLWDPIYLRHPTLSNRYCFIFPTFSYTFIFHAHAVFQLCWN